MEEIKNPKLETQTSVCSYNDLSGFALEPIVEQDDSPARQAKGPWARFKDALSIVPKGGTTPPWTSVFLVFFSLWSSALTITFLFPFLPEMILKFGYNEGEKGYFVGMIASSMFVGRSLGSYFWGWLSDRWGRKPVLIVCILGNGFATLAFGFSTNIYIAIATRFITGLLNGAVGTAKTIMYEISDTSNQAVGMSALSLSWGLGVSVGPFIGGYLADPAEKYPATFGGSAVFLQFPYLLPSVFPFLVAVVASCVTYCLLPETLQSKKKGGEVGDTAVGATGTVCMLETREDSGYDTVTANAPPIVVSSEKEGAAAPSTQEKSEEEHLLPHVQNSKHNCGGEGGGEAESLLVPSPDDAIRPRIGSNASRVSRVAADEDVPRCRLGSVTGLRRTSLMRSISATRSKQQLGSAKEEEASRGGGCCAGTLCLLCRDKSVCLSIGLYTLFSFAVIGFDDVFTVWASTTPDLGGIGMTSSEIGLAIGVMSLPMLFLQMWIFPKLESAFGAIRSFQICGILMMIILSAMPTIRVLHDNPTGLWIALFVLMVPERITGVCCFGATGLMINNSAPPSLAGAANGLAMTATAIARSFAPTVAGSIFAWSVTVGESLGPPFDVNLAFFFLGLTAFVAVLMSVWAPPSLNRQSKKVTIEAETSDKTAEV